ncbi:hypothetical protein FRC06_011413 [Ceratobasidium sp. 370]|nr:hypothetical protein FRC06_011413 [Ceratobasidium sp. 370]
MVAVNSTYAILVYRYTTANGLPEPHEPWNFFPLNNPQFMEVAGIESVEVGLSQPPQGKLGLLVPSQDHTDWPHKAVGALKFLEHCDTMRRQIRNRTPTIEEFQPQVMRKAPHRDDWDWVVDHFFGVPGGFYERVRYVMADSGCNGEEAYRRARADQMHEMRDKFREGDVPNAAKFDNVWLEARNAVGRALLGDPMENGCIPSMYWATLRALCYRHFEKEVRTLKTSAEKIEANNHPTKKRLRIAGELLSQVQNLHRALGIKGRLAETAQWKVRIDQLFEQLGRKRVNGRMVRVNASHPKAHLLSDEDLNQSWAEYQQALWTPAPSEAGPFDIDFDSDEQAEGPLPGLNDFGPDAGVGHWGKVSTSEIKKMLLIPASGLPGMRLKDDGSPMMEPMRHQWVALLEMVDRSFAKPGALGRPTLLADEVGMGKTALGIMFIQALWHLKALQDGNPKWPETHSSDGLKKWPLFLGERKVFMGHERIPVLPSWIAAPTTLIAQWNGALNSWLADNACHIITYSGNAPARKTFFEAGQPYDIAMKSTRPERTIILVEMPTMLTEGRVGLPCHGNRDRGEPSSGPATETGFLARNYAAGILDEGHSFRNNGPNNRTVTTMMSKCAQRIVLTATPVYTGCKDLLSIGRILQAPRFIGTAGQQLTTKVEKLIKSADKSWDDIEGQSTLREFLLELRQGSSGSTSSNDVTTDPEPRELLGELEKDLSPYRAFWGARKALYVLRQEMTDYIIRRDCRSRDIDGQLLLDLKPIVEIKSYLRLDEKTKQVMALECAQKDHRNRARMDLDGFFTPIRKILVHPCLVTAKKTQGQSQEDFVRELFPTKEAYQNNPSPKIDRVLEILGHHFGDSNSHAPPLLWNEAGEQVEANGIWDPVQNDPEGGAVRRKAAIYCHLSESWTLLSHILELHGIPCLMLNGSMDKVHRDASVEAFQSEQGPDVIILSDVGSVGLNLQRGSLMLFVDHPWSASDSQQLSGRLQRRGQASQVISYKLITLNTADEFLLGYAEGKKLMMQVFTQECITHNMPGFEWEDKEEEGSDEEDVKRRRKPRATKAPARSRKVPNEASGSSHATTTSPPKSASLPDMGATPNNPGGSGSDTPQHMPTTFNQPTHPKSSISNMPKGLPKKKGQKDREEANPPPPKSKQPRKVQREKEPDYYHPDFPQLGVRPRQKRDRERWEKEAMKLALEKMERDRITAEIRAELQVEQRVQAKALLDAIQQGRITAPPELVKALIDPNATRAPHIISPTGHPAFPVQQLPSTLALPDPSSHIGSTNSPMSNISPTTNSPAPEPKGKGKVTTPSSPATNIDAETGHLDKLLPEHGSMIGLMSSGTFTWDEVQDLLARKGLPPLPLSYRPNTSNTPANPIATGSGMNCTTQLHPVLPKLLMATTGYQMTRSTIPTHSPTRTSVPEPTPTLHTPTTPSLGSPTSLDTERCFPHAAATGTPKHIALPPPGLAILSGVETSLLNRHASPCSEHGSPECAPLPAPPKTPTMPQPRQSSPFPTIGQKRPLPDASPVTSSHGHLDPQPETTQEKRQRVESPPSQGVVSFGCLAGQGIRRSSRNDVTPSNSKPGFQPPTISIPHAMAPSDVPSPLDSLVEPLSTQLDEDLESQQEFHSSTHLAPGIPFSQAPHSTPRKKDINSSPSGGDRGFDAANTGFSCGNRGDEDTIVDVESLDDDDALGSFHPLEASTLVGTPQPSYDINLAKESPSGWTQRHQASDQWISGRLPPTRMNLNPKSNPNSNLGSHSKASQPKSSGQRLVQPSLRQFVVSSSSKDAQSSNRSATQWQGPQPGSKAAQKSSQPLTSGAREEDDEEQEAPALPKKRNTPKPQPKKRAVSPISDDESFAATASRLPGQRQSKSNNLRTMLSSMHKSARGAAGM